MITEYRRVSAKDGTLFRLESSAGPDPIPNSRD
jgi:hypothetical protein